MSLPGRTTYSGDQTRVELRRSGMGAIAGVTIRPGESLARIAKQYGVDLPTLIDQNRQFSNPDVVHAGEFVRLPGQAVDPKAMREKVLRSREGFDKLPLATQKQLLTASRSEGSNAALYLSSSPEFAALSEKQQSQVLGLGEEMGMGGSMALNDLVTSGKATAVDREGATTLDRLGELAWGPRAKELDAEGVTRSELLRSVTTEITRPDQINQGSKGTCTTTSLSYELAKREPAEYVRLVSGLASNAGQVQMANGHILKAPEGVYANDTATTRSPSERILQASLMDYGNGFFRDYDNANDQHQIGFLQTGGGLRPSETLSVRNALFDVDDKVSYGRDLKGALQKAPAGVGTVGIKVRTEDTGHAVSFEKFENGRVYYRNPWGEGRTFEGARNEGPGGLESVSLNDPMVEVRTYTGPAS